MIRLGNKKRGGHHAGQLHRHIPLHSDAGKSRINHAARVIPREYGDMSFDEVYRQLARRHA